MKFFINIRQLSGLVLVLFLAGCTSHVSKTAQFELSTMAVAAGSTNQSDNQTDNQADSDDYEDEYADLDSQVADPLESWNRVMFAFNDVTYRFIAKPISKGYDFIVPSPVRTGIKNFFYNLTFPVRFVGNFLQGKGTNAGFEFTQFLVNSTFGIGGLIDFYQRVEPDNPLKDDEDFGQVLAHMGLGDGFYIVWPLLGPSTARNTLGMIGDALLNPVTYISHWKPRLATVGINTVNGLSERLRGYDAMKKNAIEPYSALRDGYIQFRKGKLER